MNKYTFVIIAILSAVTSLSSQIIINNTNFPNQGDTLKTAIDFNFTGTLDMGSTNGPKVWDFNVLKKGDKQTTVYINAALGNDIASFPEANLLTLDENGQESYFKKSSSKIEALGFGGNNPFIQAPVAVKLSKRPIVRKAPLEFINSTDTESEFKLDIGTSIIPDTILDLLPIKPDSIRILFSNQSKGLVDAYGTLNIQGTSFEVLREKRQEISSTKFLIKVPLLGWFDPSGLLGGNIPVFGDLLGLDTTVVYNFYSNSKKETIVSAEFDLRNELQSVAFIDLGNVISATQDDDITSNFYIYPNPAKEFLKIKNLAWANGAYWLAISDMKGKVVYIDALALKTGDESEINISNLPSGLYVLSLRDQFNKVQKSVKFIIE